MSGHTRDITPLLGISSARYSSLHILRNQHILRKQQNNKSKLSYVQWVPPSRSVNPVGETRVEQRTPGLKKLPYSVVSERKRPPNEQTTTKQLNPSFQNLPARNPYLSGTRFSSLISLHPSRGAALVYGLLQPDPRVFGLLWILPVEIPH
jgi:hypothetical protein